jgi:xeroderma pigmentosum group C-complementing protein
MGYRKRALIQEERLKRILSHKIHTVALIANARVRNTWLNDELLHVCKYATYKIDTHD